MDHVSDYGYVYLMRDLSLSEILLDKEALEKLMAQSKQNFKHYQSDNESFFTMVSLMPLIKNIKR